MPTTSSLLRSADAARKKVLAYEDQVAAFEWENSAKTADEFNKYAQHLQTRSQTYSAVDPSASLSYQTKLRTAQRAFRTEEIQRASIDIQQGRGNTTDKYNKTYELYQMALENGDMNSVQNLTQQLGSLDIQIQNEQEKAQRVAEVAAKTRTTDMTKMADKLLNGTEVITLNDGTVIVPLKLLNQTFTDKGQTKSGNYFTEARATIEATANKLQEALSVATDQETYDTIAEKLRELQYKTFGTPAGNLSYDGIMKAEMMQNSGNPLYIPAQGDFNAATQNQEFKMKKMAVDDIVWGRDQNGKYIPIETTASKEDSLDVRFNDKGEIVDEFQKDQYGRYQTDKNGNRIKNKDYEKFADRTLKNLLASQGMESYSEGGQLYARNPLGQIGDVQAGVPVRIVVGADGRVKYIREKDGNIGFYELDPITGRTKEITTPFDATGYTTIGNADATKNRPDLFGIELLQKTLPMAGFSLLEKANLSRPSNFLESQQQKTTLEEMKKQGYVTPLSPTEVKNRAAVTPTPIVNMATQAITQKPQQTGFSNVLSQNKIGGSLTPEQLKAQGLVTPLKPAAPTATPTPSVFNLAAGAIRKSPF